MTRLRRAVSALCVAGGLAATGGMVGAALALPHPQAPVGFLGVVVIGCAAAGSVTSPREAAS